MPLQWRNQIWQSLEEGAGKRCRECGLQCDVTPAMSHSCQLCLCLLQVIDGGDLDIDFVLYAPDGRVLQMESRKTENVIR